MKRTVENLTFLVFAAGLVILAVVGYISYETNLRLAEESSWVAHTYEVLGASEAVSTAVGRAESAVRGYVITTNPRYIAAFHSAEDALESALAKLRDLSSDNPSQENNIAVLAGLAHQRLNVMQQTLDLRRKESYDAAAALVRSDAAQTLAQRIRQQIGVVQGEENRLLSSREAAAHRIAHWSRVITWLGDILALIIVGGATLLIRSENQARESARRRFAVQYATTRLLAESSGVDQAAQRLLPELAIALEFDLAELWLPDEQKKMLRCNHYWISQAVPGEYKQALSMARIPVGEGVPGRVFTTREPLWIENLQRESMVNRKEAIQLAGVKPGVAVPILIWPEVVGVIVLASRRPMKLDRELFQTLTGIGDQFGQFMNRVRALSRLRETTQLQQAILQSANFAIVAVDAMGVIQSMNVTAERWMQYSAEELVGKRTPEIFFSPDELMSRANKLSEELGKEVPAGVNAILEKARLGLVDENEWSYVRKDGETFPVLLSVTAMQDTHGNATGYVCIAQDITERREVDRMKNEFISVVSHELRTPLTSIRGSLGLLASGLLGSVTEKANRMLQIAVNNTDRLVRLINDILDIERLESGRVTLERRLTDSETLIGQAVEVMRPLADKSGVQLYVQAVPARIDVAGDRIVQTLTNLITNAIKFSDAGSAVEIGSRVENGEVVFHVRDYGRGIPEDKLAVIFERFQQVDASDSREKSGTGLGLAICRTIVHQHGGRIWVESQPGLGSTFYFTVPLAVQSETAIAQTRGPRVIVCDDDPSLLKVASGILENAGFSAVTATSGEELLEKARARRPDAIVLDLVLPGMSGWEALSQLRSDPRLSEVPVIILTGLSEKEHKSQATGTFASWVQKPFDAAKLCAQIGAATRANERLVLLVEDDADLAKVMRSTFEVSGVEVVVARGASDALRLAKARVPDLMILDLVLAEGDGYQVVSQMRQDDHLRNIPVVVYSSADVSGNAKERLKLGKTEFLIKTRVSPLELEQLVLRTLQGETARAKGDENG